MSLKRLRRVLEPLRLVIGPILRPLRRILRRIKASGARPITSYSFHDLTMNHNLTSAEHKYCPALGTTIQALYDDAPDYVARHRLDPDIFLPRNEWAGIIPNTGRRFRTEYNFINYLRLHAPFAGYHLAVLDRMDSGGKFPKADAEAFVIQLTEAVPDDIAEQQRKRFDPIARLKHVIPEYLDHIRNVPARYIVQTPRMFGEIGLDINGVLVHSDVMLCQSRINGMYCAGVLKKIEEDIAARGYARIMEIGAGYGALANALKRIFNDRLEYIVVDLPSSLWYSAIYLSTLAGGEDSYVLKPNDTPPAHFKNLFISNHMLDSVLPHIGPIDVAINTMSFPEMSAAQIRYYGNVIKQLMGKNGVLFEENAALHPHHVDNKAIFAEVFPYHRKVSSNIVTTKNWCQDVWTNRYRGDIFDCSDSAAIDNRK